MESIRILPVLLICLVSLVGAQPAQFVGYDISFEYRASPGRRYVSSVTANLTAFANSPSTISGSNLWKVTLFASNDDDGANQLRVFPGVVLSQDQADHTFVPGEVIHFSIPLDLNMDDLDGYKYLCLRSEKNPDANPDFEFVFNSHEEATLCLQINFDEVPVVEYPVPPVLVAVATEKVEVTNVTLNASFVQPLKTSPVVYSTVYYIMRFSQNTSVIEGEDLWVINFFVSKTNDGTKSKVNIASYRQTSGTSKIEPGGELTFKFFANVEYDGYGPGTDYPYACFSFSKHPQTDADVTFMGEEMTFKCIDLPAIALPTPMPIEETYHTCRLWGDPHQVTFDSYGYTHQGDAEYIAVTTCFNEDESVPNFEIVVDNFRRKPSIPVTYIREHRLYYNDVVYSLTHPDEVSVDGESITLPYRDYENGVNIHYAAPHKILTTDFGLTIRFDNMHNSDITLPDRFMNKVCGLCGNFDGERSNECHYRNGTWMNQHNEDCKLIHAEEWIFDTPETGIPTDFKPTLRSCEEGSPYLDAAKQHCSILTNSSGPLSDCIQRIDPATYFSTCIYDLCQLLPEVLFLCGSVETYIYNCGKETNWEAEIGDWRAVATECQPSCKGNMTYNRKGPACPPSCGDPEGSTESCPFPSLETCQCPEGTLLDGTDCVPIDKCGCTMENGRYLSIGQHFVKRGCNEYCSCEGTDDLQCHELTCAENAYCGIKAGRRDCYCDEGYMGNGRTECTTASKVCHIYGDPHFHTFDEDFYSFQGDCTYVAVETCGHLPAGVQRFKLVIHNDALIPEERFTYLTAVRLNFARNTYKLKYTGEIIANDVNKADSLPYIDDNVQISRRGKYITLVTSFGLKITYDGENDAEIELPPSYFGKVCGLCGNADGNSTNDKQMPNGTLAKKLDFANSWGVGDCPIVGKPVQTCEPGTKDYNKAVDVCSELASAEGPFAYCHSFKRPFKFVDSCIYDLCGTLPSTDLFCNSAEQYLQTCAEKGGIIDEDWESKVKYCGTPNCPEGYDSNKQSCYKFFADPVTRETAKGTCEREGGHLVTISSRGENNFVSQLGQNERLWLGATRNASASYSPYESAANDMYTFLPDRLTRGIGSFRFSVRSHSDAHILLSSTKDIDGTTPVYEIVLGANRNNLNLIRRCQDCLPKVDNGKGYLKKRRFVDFFVNFHEGNIQVGEMKNRELILEFMDPLPMRVRYIAFKSVGRVGSWKFYDRATFIHFLVEFHAEFTHGDIVLTMFYDCKLDVDPLTSIDINLDHCPTCSVLAEFTWDTGEPWNFDNYRFGEPSNYHSEEGCLETNFLRPGIWNDHFCSERKAFVCEVEGY